MIERNTKGKRPRFYALNTMSGDDKGNWGTVIGWGWSRAAAERIGRRAQPTEPGAYLPILIVASAGLYKPGWGMNQSEANCFDCPACPAWPCDDSPWVKGWADYQIVNN